MKPPSTDEEIKLAMKPYIDAGMPGAIASIDGVHVAEQRWKRRISLTCISSLLL